LTSPPPPGRCAPLLHVPHHPVSNRQFDRDQGPRSPIGSVASPCAAGRARSRQLGPEPRGSPARRAQDDRRSTSALASRTTGPASAVEDLRPCPRPGTRVTVGS
jgi:hypothetical protein